METITTLALFVVILIGGLALAVGTVAWLWRALQTAGAGYVKRLDEQEAEIDDLRRQIIELREGRIADSVLLHNWINYARRLGQMLREETGQEPPPEPDEVRRNVAQDAARLGRTIAFRFSLSEIDGLAFELGVSEAIGGATAADRAASLVDVARRRGLLLRLTELCRRDRPEGGF